MQNFTHCSLSQALVVVGVWNHIYTYSNQVERSNANNHLFKIEPTGESLVCELE